MYFYTQKLDIIDLTSIEKSNLPQYLIDNTSIKSYHMSTYIGIPGIAEKICITYDNNKYVQHELKHCGMCMSHGNWRYYINN